MCAARGKDGAVHLEARFHEHIERPGAARDEREARRPERAYRLSHGLFEAVLAAAELVPELLRRLLEDQGVDVRVRADLMAAAVDLAHQLGIFPRNPAETEEGRLRVGLFQQVENPCQHAW